MRKVTLRTALLVLFVLQIIMAVSTVGYLSFRTGQLAISEFSLQLRQEISLRIKERALEYLEAPHLVNQLNSYALADNITELKNEAAIEKMFWRQLLLFPKITQSYVANASGQNIGAWRLEDSIEVFTVEANGNGYNHSVDEDGNRLKKTESYTFDPRVRPWYTGTAKAKKPIWSKVYADFHSKQLVTTATLPLYSRQNELLGVFGTEFWLADINQFLKSLEVGKTGGAFLMDREGFFLSTSTEDPVFEIQGETTRRFQARDSQNDLIKHAALNLDHKFGSLANIVESQPLKFNLHGEHHFLQVAPLADQYGLDWLIVVVIPEKDLMARIHENNRTTLWLCCLSVGVAFMIALFASRWITYPISSLNKATRKIATGDWGHAVTGTRIHEVGALLNSFTNMARQLQEREREQVQLNTKLDEYNQTLEKKVEERTKDLNLSLEKVKEANEEIMESIRYAEMIQRSMLPALDIFKTNVPDSFVIWMPRNIVGGDIIYADFTKTGIVVALVDCTGHGVPGAFMSMIASSGLRKIISDEGFSDPAEILKKLNYFVKKSLQQDSEAAESDDGMDVAVCYFNKREQTITFAGAKQPLFLVEDGELKYINGDRQSIGYKKSDLEFNFTNHRFNLKDGMSFYLSTDGFVDQLGGDNRRIFGKKKFKQILLENHSKPYDIQRNELMEAFYDHKGNNDRQDDVTLLGWSLTKYKQTVVLIATVDFSDSAVNNKSRILETYLKNITPDVKNNDGHINNDTSDSIMIFFSNKADAAINTSIMMQESLRKLSQDNEDIANGITSISVGIYTCTLAVRSFEELETIDKEDIANEIQLATALSSLNKKFNTSTLICDTSFSKLKKIADYNHRFIGRIRLQEKREELAVFEIFDADLKDAAEKKQKNLEEYDRGIFYYKRL